MPKLEIFNRFEILYAIITILLILKALTPGGVFGSKYEADKCIFQRADFASKHSTYLASNFDDSERFVHRSSSKLIFFH